MGEIKSSEAKEVKTPEAQGFKDIKPENGTDLKNAENFMAERFQSPEAEKSLSEVIKDYINDLKDKSDSPETISESAIDIFKLERQTPEKVSEMREDFDDNKKQLRKEWESLNGKEWPKYNEDVKNENGQIIRHAGDNYDAHHIQPLCLGGKNEASNITPLDMTKHKEVHSIEGSCAKLVNKVGGET